MKETEYNPEKKKEKNVPGQSEGGISRYKLGGTADDDWGDNNGTNNGADLTATGVYGKAAQFNSSNEDYIEIEHSSLGDSLTSNTTTAFTGWFKRSYSGSDWMWLAGNRNQGRGYEIVYNLQNGAVGDIALYVRNYDNGDLDAIYTTEGYSDGNWHNFAAIRDGDGASNLYLYIHGRLADTEVQSNDNAGTWTQNGYVGIGGVFNPETSSIDGPFEGKIDDVRIYDRALTPLQVEKLYHKGAYRIPRESTLQ